VGPHEPVAAKAAQGGAAALGDPDAKQIPRSEPASGNLTELTETKRARNDCRARFPTPGANQNIDPRSAQMSTDFEKITPARSVDSWLTEFQTFHIARFAPLSQEREEFDRTAPIVVPRQARACCRLAFVVVVAGRALDQEV
jgi:hypothetical protein